LDLAIQPRGRETEPLRGIVPLRVELSGPAVELDKNDLVYFVHLLKDVASEQAFIAVDTSWSAAPAFKVNDFAVGLMPCRVRRLKSIVARHVSLRVNLAVVVDCSFLEICVDVCLSDLLWLTAEIKADILRPQQPTPRLISGMLG